jgi:hypothetical protein
VIFHAPEGIRHDRQLAGQAKFTREGEQEKKKKKQFDINHMREEMEEEEEANRN